MILYMGSPMYDLAFKSEMKHVVNIFLQFRQKAAKQNLYIVHLNIYSEKTFEASKSL